MRTLKTFLTLMMVAACGSGGAVLHPRDAAQDGSLGGGGGSVPGTGGAFVSADGAVGMGGAGGNSDAAISGSADGAVGTGGAGGNSDAAVSGGTTGSGGSNGGVTKTGGSSSSTCPLLLPCNWCSGREIRGSSGCVTGWLCANGEDPCKTSPCTNSSSCPSGYACSDRLCWPADGGAGGSTGGDAGARPDAAYDGPPATPDGASSISVIHVHINMGDTTVTLPNPIQSPISKEDAELVRKQSGCGCPGDLVLKDANWTTSCCEAYPDCSIKIDQKTGEVTCGLYG